MKDNTYIRDSSGALINTDMGYYDKILLMRKQKKESIKVIERVDSLESDLKEIKNLLLQLINGKK